MSKYAIVFYCKSCGAFSSAFGATASEAICRAYLKHRRASDSLKSYYYPTARG